MGLGQGQNLEGGGLGAQGDYGGLQGLDASELLTRNKGQITKDFPQRVFVIHVITILPRTKHNITL